MTDNPARTDVPGRAEAAQREPSMHDEAVDIAQQWLRFTEHGAPPHVLASAPHRYIVGVLTAFPAMRAALEEAMRWNLVDYGPCVCREPVGMHTDRCKAFNAALRAARAVEQP